LGKAELSSEGKNMKEIQEKLPEKINRLHEVAYNVWWSWTPQARGLFRSLDYPLWRKTLHNPVKMLREISVSDLESAAADSVFMRKYNRVMMLYDRMMSGENSWFEQEYPQYKGKTIAYFSFEFGLAQLAADLLRRFGHLIRRSCQSFQ
jgi:starch phosphorylase